MQQHNLNGFSDANEFIVLDGIPHYVKTGNTYMEIFRAGLSLENMIEFNNCVDHLTSSTSSICENTDEKEKKTFIKHIYDVEDISEPAISHHNHRRHTHSKKKYLLKKTKKNKINVRNSGYNWKLFKITQELGECVDIEPQPITIKKVHIQEKPYFLDEVNYTENIEDMEDIFIYNNRYYDYYEDDFDMYLDDDYDFDIDFNEPYLHEHYEYDEDRERRFRIWSRTHKYMSKHRM